MSLWSSISSFGEAAAALGTGALQSVVNLTDEKKSEIDDGWGETTLDDVVLGETEPKESKLGSFEVAGPIDGERETNENPLSTSQILLPTLNSLASHLPMGVAADMLNRVQASITAETTAEEGATEDGEDGQASSGDKVAEALSGFASRMATAVASASKRGAVATASFMAKNNLTGDGASGSPWDSDGEGPMMAGLRSPGPSPSSAEKDITPASAMQVSSPASTRPASEVADTQLQSEVRRLKAALSSARDEFNAEKMRADSFRSHIVKVELSLEKATEDAAASESEWHNRLRETNKALKNREVAREEALVELKERVSFLEAVSAEERSRREDAEAGAEAAQATLAADRMERQRLTNAVEELEAQLASAQARLLDADNASNDALASASSAARLKAVELARRLQETQADIRTLQERLAGAESDQLCKQASDDAKARSDSELRATAERLRAVESSESAMREQIVLFDQQVKQLQNELSVAREAAAGAADSAELLHRLNEQGDELSTARSRVLALEGESEVLLEKSAHSEAEARRLRLEAEDLRALRAVHSDTADAGADAERRFNEVAAVMEARGVEIDDLTHKLARLTEQLDSAHRNSAATCARLTAEAQQATERATVLRHELDRAEAAVESANDSYTSADGAATAMREEMAKLADEAEAAKSAATHAEDRVQQFMREIAAAVNGRIDAERAASAASSIQEEQLDKATAALQQRDKQLAAADEQVRTMSTALLLAQREAAELRLAVEAASSSTEAGRTQIEGAQTEAMLAAVKVTELSTALAAAQERAQAAESGAETAGASLARLERSFEKLQGEFRGALARESEAVKGAERESIKVAELQSLLANLRASLEHTVADTDAASRQVSVTRGENTALRAQITDLHAEMQRAALAMEELRRERDDGTGAIAELQSECERMRVSHSLVQTAWGVREAELNGACAAVTARAAALAGVQDEAERMKAEVASRDAELSSLSESASNLHLVIEGLSAGKNAAETRELEACVARDEAQEQLARLRAELAATTLRIAGAGEAHAHPSMPPAGAPNTSTGTGGGVDKLPQAHVRIAQLQQTIHELRAALADAKAMADVRNKQSAGEGSVDRRLAAALVVAFLAMQRTSGRSLGFGSVRARDALNVLAGVLDLTAQERDSVGLGDDVTGHAEGPGGSVVSAVGGFLGSFLSPSTVQSPGRNQGGDKGEEGVPASLGSAFVQFLLEETADVEGVAEQPDRPEK